VVGLQIETPVLTLQIAAYFNKFIGHGIEFVQPLLTHQTFYPNQAIAKITLPLGLAQRFGWSV
jgi:hypothetical protein